MSGGYPPSLMAPTQAPMRPMAYYQAFKRPLPFDQYLCEHFFPRVPEGDDSIVTQVCPRYFFRNILKFSFLGFVTT